MDNHATNVEHLKEFTLEYEKLISDGIELIKWFDENEEFKGVNSEYICKAPSECMYTSTIS
ncbi:hypothetical protein N2E09_08135 [Leuconostoc citreum]